MRLEKYLTLGRMYNIKRVRDILKKGLKTPLKTGDDQKLLQHKKSVRAV